MRLSHLITALCLTTAAAVATPQYRAEEKIGEGRFKAMLTYLAENGGKLYALDQDGSVAVFDTESGAFENAFSSGLANTQCLAINPKGEIFIFSTKTVSTERVYNNRKYTMDEPVGVQCKVFDREGKALRELDLSELKSAKSAQFLGETLVIGDLQQRKLFFLDPASGEKTAEVAEGLRLCCGIFDFCAGPDNTVTVANLGAFKVQQYDRNGKLVNEFGKRGKEMEQFHGCCNPVSLGYLADGAVVTVEKDTTRIKIFDASGKQAQQIEGIEELVEGCSHIPIVIDAKGSIFLAAGRKGYIVKCVPKT